MKKIFLIVTGIIFVVVIVVLYNGIEKPFVCKEKTSTEVKLDKEGSFITVHRTDITSSAESKKKECVDSTITIPIQVEDNTLYFPNQTNEIVDQISLAQKKHPIEVLFSHGTLENEEINYFISYAATIDEKRVTREIKGTIDYVINQGKVDIK